MSSVKITDGLLLDYANNLNVIDRHIYLYNAVLNNVKDKDGLVWILSKNAEFNEFYHVGILDEIVTKLKDLELGKSMDELKLYVGNQFLLQSIIRRIEIDIFSNHGIDVSLGFDNPEINDLNDPKILFHQLNKFLFWGLALSRGLSIISLEKEPANFPFAIFLNFFNQAHSWRFKSQSEITAVLESSKGKYRQKICKDVIIDIESNLKSARYYLGLLKNAKK
jgi:hypothetical protein